MGDIETPSNYDQTVADGGNLLTDGRYEVKNEL